MTDQKYTSDGLPVVSNETCRALLERLTGNRRGLVEVLVGFMNSLPSEQPPLAEAFTEYSRFSTGKNRRYFMAFMHGALLMYEALRAQSSANNLGELLQAKKT